MKTILSVAFSFLALFSLSSFADKIMITGEPIVLEQRGDLYYLPENYTATTSYHYVTIAGTNKVCYAEKQPNLASLNGESVTVQLGGKSVEWTCYPYDETYFTVTQ